MLCVYRGNVVVVPIRLENIFVSGRRKREGSRNKKGTHLDYRTKMIKISLA